MKKVLFVCVENSCRSQMAEGLARNLGAGIIEAYSAGSQPSGKINPEAIRVMQELGMDISSQQSKGFDQLPTKEFDVVITLGCQDTCPFVPARQRIDWHIEDPKNKDAEFFRKVRDDIAEVVKELVRTCGAPGT